MVVQEIPFTADGTIARRAEERKKSFIIWDIELRESRRDMYKIVFSHQAKHFFENGNGLECPNKKTL